MIGEIEEAKRQCADSVFSVEQKVDISDYVPDCFGTADMMIVTDKLVHIIDLKLGKGVPVYAEKNPQLMIYGLGVLEIAEMLFPVEMVRLTIFQPRLSNSSTWEITPAVSYTHLYAGKINNRCNRSFRFRCFGGCIFFRWFRF